TAAAARRIACRRCGRPPAAPAGSPRREQPSRAGHAQRVDPGRTPPPGRYRVTRIAVNGLGRIGKLVLRRLVEQGMGTDVVLLNDAVGDPALHAHLLEFDSVHGRWPARVEAGEGTLSVDGHAMRLAASRTLEDLPLRELGIALVLDCTGAFKTPAKL